MTATRDVSVDVAEEIIDAIMDCVRADGDCVSIDVLNPAAERINNILARRAFPSARADLEAIRRFAATGRRTAHHKGLDHKGLFEAIEQKANALLAASPPPSPEKADEWQDLLDKNVSDLGRKLAQTGRRARAGQEER
jgi:hypothetical protein